MLLWPGIKSFLLTNSSLSLLSYGLPCLLRIHRLNSFRWWNMLFNFLIPSLLYRDLWLYLRQLICCSLPSSVYSATRCEVIKRTECRSRIALLVPDSFFLSDVLFFSKSNIISVTSVVFIQVLCDQAFSRLRSLATSLLRGTAFISCTWIEISSISPASVGNRCNGQHLDTHFCITIWPSIVWIRRSFDLCCHQNYTHVLSLSVLLHMTMLFHLFLVVSCLQKHTYGELLNSVIKRLWCT